MPGRKRHVTEIDGPSYLLEQVLHGEEGQDFTRSTLTDGTEVIGVGDGICFERSATGATTVQFARKPKAKRQGKYHAIDVLTPRRKAERRIQRLRRLLEIGRASCRERV